MSNLFHENFWTYKNVNDYTHSFTVNNNLQSLQKNKLKKIEIKTEANDYPFIGLVSKNQNELEETTYSH